MRHGMIRRLQGISKMEDNYFTQRLYERLVDIIGNEEDIHSRREVFRILDIVNAFGDKDSIRISSGSLSEGFDLQGSDEDVTILIKNVDVIPGETEATQNEGNLKVFMEVDREHKRYVSLYLHEEEERFVMAKGDSEHTELLFIKNSLEHVKGKCILSSSKFREQFIRPGFYNHGPCSSDGDHDFAFSLYGSVWPEIAKQRLFACTSKQWITEELVTGLLSEGCIYVPVGPQAMGPQDIDSQTLWRMSFVTAEKRFVEAMNHIQFLCYGLLKIVLKERIANQPSDYIISSYILKTCLFWLIEESNNDTQVWNRDRLYSCFLRCISKLIDWVEACDCPNYILPSNNMFCGKVTTDNKSAILRVLLEVKNGGYEVLSSCKTLGPFMMTSRVTEAEQEAKLDLMCSRMLHVYPFDDKDLLLQALQHLEKESSQETRPFQKGVIEIQMARLYRELAQMIHVNKGTETCEELRFQEECLRRGCRCEPLTGMIHIGSFHVRRGRYYTAIEILNSVSQKLNPKQVGVMLRRKPEYSPEEVEHYTRTFCGRGLSLQDKWRVAFVGEIIFLDQSAIVPEEFQPEANCRPLIMAPPAVYLHALLFLCYHHLNDMQKAQETLITLEHIMEMRYLFRHPCYSDACTLVGACYETCCDYGNAKRYYFKALNVPHPSAHAKYRLKRVAQSLLPAV